MTEQEVNDKLAESKPSPDSEDKEKSLMNGIMTALFFAGKDRDAKICSVLADTLREGPELTLHIRAFMKQG